MEGGVLDWIKSWPPTVWATIGGSAIALVGVFFSDWRNTRRLNIQHQFAARESELARLADIRRDVYLPAAGVLARVQEYLISLPAIEHESASGPIIEFSELVGKVSMVGELETVVIAQELAADYTEAHATLSLLASNVKAAQRDLTRNREYREKAAAHVERVGVEIAKFLEAGSRDEIQFKAMQRSQASFQERTRSYSDQEIEAAERFSKETNKFIVQALDVVAPLGDAGARLLISVREELGQKTDSEKLLLSIRGQRDRAFQRIRDLADSIDKERAASAESPL